MSRMQAGARDRGRPQRRLDWVVRGASAPDLRLSAGKWRFLVGG
jgi:hypothetical protein